MGAAGRFAPRGAFGELRGGAFNFEGGVERKERPMATGTSP